MCQKNPFQLGSDAILGLQNAVLDQESDSMPGISPAELARRFRRNAEHCEQASAKDVSGAARDLLMKTAVHYRLKAEDLERRSSGGTPPRAPSEQRQGEP